MIVQVGLENGRRRLHFVRLGPTPWLDWRLLTKRPMNIARSAAASWLEQPQPNMWLGTSVEDQERAELRIPHLVKVPAMVHFLSCDPLLGALNLEPWMHDEQWVISGGESGPQHRAVDGVDQRTR